MTTADPDPRGLVLVVEDDRAIADLIRLYLVRAGFGVHVEGDGAGALLAAARLAPAAVVLDVGLPGVDGVEVCRRLRASGDWTPVLFVTAHDDVDVHVAQLRAKLGAACPIRTVRGTGYAAEGP